MNKGIIVCSRCVLDTTVKDIKFNASGECNYCSDFIERHLPSISLNGQDRKDKLDRLVSKIKEDGKFNKYDCVVGVSGGVDSSWALVKAVELGLRPLAVHMDNGWNADLSVHNIKNLVEKLGVGYKIYKVDEDEYNSLLNCFLAADVVDIEVLYDNAMLAVNYKFAKENDIKYILSGSNLATEGIKIPTGWNWLKKDKKNILSIARSFNGAEVNTLPVIGTVDYIKYEFINKIKWLPFLDYFEFNKESSLQELEKTYSYIRYPFKHYESILTRFYQGYILPEKFNIDKRKLHFSTLIITKQMSRDEALLVLKEPPYESDDTLRSDKALFLSKLNWAAVDFNKYIARPEQSHGKYGSEKWLWDICHKAYLAARKIF